MGGTAPGAPRRGLFFAARGALALGLGLLLLAACAGGKTKPTPASEAVDAATQVLAAMAQGLKGRDADALAGLWAKGQRPEALERVRAALARPGPIDVRLTLVGLRLEPGRRLARVAWEGTWGGETISGGFEMELTGADPPRIVAMRGEDPTGAGAGSGAGRLPGPLP